VEKKKDAQNRRSGVSRRSYSYAHHIPERRKGIDRRMTDNERTEWTDSLTSESDKNSSQQTTDKTEHQSSHN
jgi:hypothetical protein